jgi:immune inhibitor A
MTIKPIALIKYAFFFLLIFGSVSCSGGDSQPPPEPTQTRDETPLSTAVEVPLEAPPTSAIMKLPSGLIREPVPDTAIETMRALMEAAHLPNDYYRLAKELQGIDPVGDYKINDRMNFYVVEKPGSPNYKSLPTRLRHISENAAWWAGISVRADDNQIQALAQRFEDEVIPINQQLFGKEWSPGIDGDERIHILIVEEELWGNYFGYFSDINQYPQAIFPYSNEREMFVINIAASNIDSEKTATELAHEYQHLIHWNQDLNEDHWFNETTSELVTTAGGSIFGESNEIHFRQNPQIQLTSRPERSLGDEDKTAFAHYAAERQFAIYLFEQFGPQFIRSVMRNPDPGVIALEAELAKLPDAPDFNNVFANWLLANFLDMPDVLDGQFGYQIIDTMSPIPNVINSISGAPIQDRLPPYGARYHQVNSSEPVRLTFNGSTLTRLTPKDPYEGSFVWYSNRGDNSTFSLTRSFDLSDVDKATLNYKVWYELDNRYDYAYVEISTDSERWHILETAYGTSENPFNRSYGVGYTGSSIDWRDESIDLTPYVGQPVQIRFEVISDFTRNRDGLQLDNIEIPEIGFFDGAEDDQAGWDTQGFIRSTNLVPVDWIAWVVTPGPNIDRIDVSSEQSAVYELNGFGTDYTFALLVIAPAAPVSTMEINYEFILEH